MSTSAPLPDAKRKLLDKFVQQKFARPVESAAIGKRKGGDYAPPALSQEQVVLRDRAVRVVPLYNESITIKFNGPMDRSILERSIAEIIRRHEIWRTSYDTVMGKLVQVIHPVDEHFLLPLVDLRRISEREREAYLLKLSLAQTARPFDLRNGPLLRGALVAMTDTEYRLVMAAHQSIVDGVSVYQIFPAELQLIYKAFAEDHPSPLKPLALQFADFAAWQREWLSDADRAKQIAYWREKLAGEIPVLRWPAERERTARSYRGHIRSFTLPQSVAEGAHALAKRSGTTMFVVLLSTFYALLHSYTGQDDLIVGTLSPAGRKRSEVQGLLGYFLNPVALRVSLADDPVFAELLRRVQITISEAISNDDVPFEQVVEALGTPADATHNPYFHVGISLQPTLPETLGGWNVTSMDAESGGSMLDLYVAFIERADGLHARVQFNPDVYDLADMRRLVDDFGVLLEKLVAQPQERVSRLSSK